MGKVAAIFNQLSRQSSTVSINDAADRILAPAKFGTFSITGHFGRSLVKEFLHNVDQILGNKDGSLDIGEWEKLATVFSRKKSIPWEEIPNSGKGWVEKSDVQEFVEAFVKKELVFTLAVDTQGITEVVMSLADLDGDGRVYRADYEELIADAQGKGWQPR